MSDCNGSCIPLVCVVAAIGIPYLIHQTRIHETHAVYAYPKNATAQDHPTAAIHERCTGGVPSRSSSRRPRAGSIPTKPAASGIYRRIRWYASQSKEDVRCQSRQR